MMFHTKKIGIKLSGDGRGRLWKRAWKLATLLGVSAFLLIGMGPAALAADPIWTVSIVLHEAQSISDDDASGPDDLYWKVFTTVTGGTLIGNGHCNFKNKHQDDKNLIKPKPPWTCPVTVSGTDPVVQIVGELWDHDTTSADDHFDIHPDPNETNVVMSFRPLTNKLSIEKLPPWTTPVADPAAKCALGNIKSEGFHGGDYGKIVFSVHANTAGSVKGDTDNDGLLDSWEICGYDANKDGVVDVDLPAMGAKPLHKDLFVEIDWMIDDDGTADDHSHEPWLPALINAWHEFDQAPVTNPDSKGGIALHVDVGGLYANYYGIDFDGDGSAEINVGLDGNIELSGDGIPDIGNLGALGTGTTGGGNSLTEVASLASATGSPGDPFGAGSGFATIKANNFQNRRDQAFRYIVFAHEYAAEPGSSGVAECGSLPACDDFIVSLGGWDRQTLDTDRNGRGDAGAPNLLGPSGLPVDGTIAQHTGTHLHELGHTLSLGHGGGDGDNYKPNYLSIMSYRWQNSGISFDFNRDGAADRVGKDFNKDGVDDSTRFIYSAKVLPDLDETSLNEPAGIGDGLAMTEYACRVPPAPGSGPIDWNCNGIDNETGITVDINGDSSQTTLSGFDDYNRIQNGGLVFQGITKQEQEQLERDRVKVRPLPDDGAVAEEVMADRCESGLLQRISFEEFPVDTLIDNQYAPLAVFLSDGLRTPWISGPGDRNLLPTQSPDQSLMNHYVSNPVPLVIEFGTPQRLAGLYLGRVTPGDPHDDRAVLSAFDEKGIPMGEVRRVPPEGITGFLGMRAIFPDQLIAKIELRYEGGAAFEPVHIDDLVLCERTKVVPAEFPPPLSFGDLPVTVSVEAKVVSETGTAEGEQDHYALIGSPLTGVPITVDSVANTTHFSLTRREGDSVTFLAPDAFSTAGSRLTFLHWEMDGHVFFPEEQTEISLILLRDATLTAVYAMEPGLCHFVVNSTLDAADTNPGDGVCQAASEQEGECTLRAAIQEANALPDTCIITLPAGTYNLTIAGVGEDDAATGDLDITNDLTIFGAGADVTIVDGGALDTVFDVLPAIVDIFGITIRNGSGSGYPGGVDNDGELTLGACTISANTASGNAGGAWNSEVMTLSNCLVTGNTAGLHGGGLHNNDSGTLTLINSTVSGNSTQIFDGGGIANLGDLILNNSTVSGNTASNDGGGIWSASSMSVTNSTISDNNASRVGGGIYVDSGTANLNNVTITGNVAEDGGGINNVAGTLNFKNTIIAGNFSAGSAPDCLGTLNSQGYNLIQNTPGCTISGDTTGNITGQDPKLAPLADNGGLTRTQALLSGSPAIDAGNPAAPGSDDDSCEATDQRGVARPQVTACDIGAYELQTVTPTSTTCLDFDGNGQVTATDVQMAAGAWRTSNATYDLDKDGKVTVADIMQVVAAWGLCPS